MPRWTALEAQLREKYPKASYASRKAKVNLIRYADGFIITGSSKELLETQILPLVTAFLHERGLELAPEKTRITRRTDGFDFLGQHIRDYAGTVLVTSSAKNKKAFLTKIRKVIKDNVQATAGNLIAQLNPIIQGWANYHCYVSSKRTFVAMDNAIFQALWRWACRRHPKKPKTWIKEKYFKTQGSRNWVFSGVSVGRGGHVRHVQLRDAADTPITRHRKIKSAANPYDRTWELYFEERLGVTMVENLRRKRKLLALWHEHDRLCPVCNQKITTLTGWRRPVF